MLTKPCRNCGRKATRPKQLCRACYFSPARAKFRPPGPRGNRLHPELTERPRRKRTLAPCPTRCLPGTPGKAEVIGERLAAGFFAFHPLDAGMGAREAERALEEAGLLRVAA